jgi:O-antigen/teichoic acid export membrane protein
VQPDGATTTRVRGYAADAFWMLAAQIAGKLASFVFVLIVARSLAAREFGYFNFALSFCPLFLVVGGFGLESTVIRRVARDRDRLSVLFATGLTLRCALGLAGLVLALAAAPLFLDGGQAYAALALVGAALLLDEVTGFLGTVFKAFERMKFHALAIFANRVVSTALAFAVLAAGGGLLALCVTYLVGSAGALLFASIALRRNFPPIDLRRADRGVALELVRTGAPLGLGGFLNTAVFRIDSVLLQAIKGPLAVGLYGAAYRLFESALFVAWSLGNVALPRLARAGSRELGRTYELTAAMALAFYLPLAVTAPFAADWVLVSLFSDRYAAAGDAVVWLAAASVLYAVAFLARIGSIAVGRTGAIAAIAAIALAFNVAANAVAIPRFGLEGAAVTTFATEALEAALLTGLFLRGSAIRSLPRPVVVPLAASGFLAAALAATGARDGVAIVLALLLYPAAVSLAAQLLAPAETRIALAALRRPAQPEHG